MERKNNLTRPKMDFHGFLFKSVYFEGRLRDLLRWVTYFYCTVHCCLPKLWCFYLFGFFDLLFTEAAMERDRFMNPDEAKEFGLIDKVLEQPPLVNEQNESNWWSKIILEPVVSVSNSWR